MKLLRHNRGHARRCRGWRDRVQPRHRARAGQRLCADRLRDAPDRPGPDERTDRYHGRGAAVAERARTRDRDRARPVDDGNEPRRGMEPGTIRLARPKWHPTDRPGADRQARANSQESHQSRGINRVPFTPVVVELRRPPPSAMPFDPAAVMERCETPRRVVDPGPTPRGHECPMPLAVGHPCCLHGGIPDLPVLGVAVPGTVAGEFVAARQSNDGRRRRHRPCRGRRWQRRPCPIQFRLHESIRRGLSQYRLKCIRPADRQSLPSVKRLRHAGRGDGRAASQHRHDGGGGGVARDDVDLAGLIRRHRPARRHQRPGLAGRHVLRPQKALPLSQRGLQAAGVQRTDIDLGGAI